MYKTGVVGYTPKAKNMAKKIEEKGFSLISATITPALAIIGP